MLSVEEALERVLSHFHPLDQERVPILEALGRVLAEEIISTLDVPPHANSAMDGYAVRAADTEGATPSSPLKLRVIGEVAAGRVAVQDVASATAIRIMTGAPIPSGADAVVCLENTSHDETFVYVRSEVGPGKDLRLAGEDVKRGQRVIEKGIRLRPEHIGMLATLGRADVAAIRRPRVAILATGDELVDVGHALPPGAIYDANSYSNTAQVLHTGGIPIRLGIARDRRQDLAKRIEEGLAQNVDLFLVSGGVSVGDFDIVKNVLAAKGEISFWRVRMKPGKPLVFGTLERERGRHIPFIGLPGNPVSAMVSFELFVRPALLKMLGETELHRPVVVATLMDSLPQKDDRRHYLRVRLEEKEGRFCAHLTGEQGSGILSSMLEADGLAVIPEAWSSAPAGGQVQILVLDRFRWNVSGSA